jgi:preprotein translocase subunit YajC
MSTLQLILQQPAQGGAMTQMLFLVAIIVVFYFFMIRPQVRKQKAEQQFRNSLEKGSKVVTIGGIHGKIVEVNEKTLLLEIDNNVRVRCERSAISADATKALESNAIVK